MRPSHLRVEHLDEPFGITVRRPRLSWRLPPGATSQSAFRIESDEWDSGKVASDHHTLVPYGGPDPVSGQRVAWRVKVWTDQGESHWSEHCTWEMGLLDAADWSAQWVAPVEDGPAEAGKRPAHLFRTEFALDDAVELARAYATAHGVYELHLNGTRVGDLELTPGCTSYRSHVQVQTYDIASLLVPGPNVLVAVVADGWYRSKTHYQHVANCFGDELALLVQLHVDLGGGRRLVLGTGPGWRTTTSHVLAADLIDGERVDLRLRRDEWHVAGADVSGWAEAPVVEHDFGRLRGSAAPPMRRVELLRPVSVTRPQPDRHVFDLGQNINGWVRLGNLGPEETRLTLTYGEALDGEGDVTQDHFPSLDYRDDVLGQIDEVVSAGRPDEWFEPRLSTKGFQYVRVEGHPGDLSADDLTGVVVHTDFRRTGWFECSDERINKLHEATLWSFRGNACDIPTDCPQRERAGWTGDWQIFVPTAAFVYDVAGFSTKWLHDLAADQWPDGRVPNCIPNPVDGGWDDKYASFFTGAAGWGDAAVIVPWELWRAYGDERLLAEQFPSMVAWVEFAARVAREERHASRVAARPEPAPHEAYLWDSRFHFGEWLAPDDDGTGVFNLERDMGDIATAFLHRSSYLLSRMAGVLGRGEEEARYAELAERSRQAWQIEYIDADGSIRPDNQPNLVRALAFGLVPDDLRKRAAAQLVALVRQAGNHLATGFLATPYLLPVLADNGYLDVAYDLLFQDTPPSWLTMIDRGATTVWEHWDGIDEHGKAKESLNHYSKGAVIAFLHTHVAGIRLLDEAPAYRRFAIEPQPGGGITSASAAHESPHGRIESAWRIENGVFVLDVVVPPGTEATVVLPDGSRADVRPGPASFRCPWAAL